MSENEFIQIVKQHRDALYRFAVRYTADGDNAWDNVQDTLVALWLHHSEIQVDKAKGLMIRVMYRQLVDQHRREERFRTGIYAEYGITPVCRNIGFDNTTITPHNVCVGLRINILELGKK
ncbi:MAG: hypothetical protein IJ896_14430 [Fibrobacter sp.]|nr:hypothetical protein [Fibrobacter sp.]